MESEINHSLNKINIERFIKASDYKVKGIVKKIIENTTYISFKEFKINLIRAFKLFIKTMEKDKIKIVYVYKTKKWKNKSNQWIYKILLKFIKKTQANLKIVLISKSNIKSLNYNDTILMPDDCIYSGMQMQGNLIREIGKYKKLKTFLNIYILCPYMSSFGIKAITYKDDEKEFNYKVKIGYHKNLDKYLLTKFLSNDELKLIQSFYSNLKPKDMLEDDDDLYAIEFQVFLIYFNHKLPDYISSLTLFYMGVVPNNYNKRILKERRRKGNKNGNLPLQIIPLIKNCNYNTNNINVNYPICPLSPYKKSDLRRYYK